MASDICILRLLLKLLSFSVVMRGVPPLTGMLRPGPLSRRPPTRCSPEPSEEEAQSRRRVLRVLLHPQHLVAPLARSGALDAQAWQ